MQVTRSKNRWKCVLKDGIVKLKGKDLLFVKVGRRVLCVCSVYFLGYQQIMYLVILQRKWCKIGFVCSLNAKTLFPNIFVMANKYSRHCRRPMENSSSRSLSSTSRTLLSPFVTNPYRRFHITKQSSIDRNSR